MTDLKNQRRMAAQLLKCGVNRVWMDPDRINEIEKAVTKSDIRVLINGKAIKAKQKKGISKGRKRFVMRQKKKGRRKGAGSRKGAKYARLPKKEKWIKTIRPLRALLRQLRDEEKNWEERQKIREDEFRIRQEEIWGEWEEQQRKRFREYSLTREAERKKIDDEMRKIDSRWDEINGIVERINQEKIKLEGDKKKIKTEWVNISEQIADLKEEEARLDKLNKEFMENKTSIVEELKERNTRSITHLPKLMSRVSDIYKEREQELRKLKSQNAIIDEKIRLIEEKWSEIESLEEDKTRDQKLIDGDRIKVRESLTKIERDLLQLKKEHLDAVVIVHPECTPDVINIADKVASTGGIINYVKKSSKKEFIIGTENGIIHRLKKENPDKIFYSASKQANCLDMKLINLEKLLWALEEEKYEIELPDKILTEAKTAIDKMLHIA